LSDVGKHLMMNIELMSKAIDFVEDNLREAITVADMAEAVSCSLYHFCRTFNQTTHHTPYDYLMRRRISESALELLQPDKKIVEIAFDYQFNSHETFSRAFKRVFGMQPNQWRKRGSIDRRRVMPRLTPAHLKHIGKGTYLKPMLEEKAAFQVAGVMTLVKHDQTVISELWELFARELESVGHSFEPGKFYGIAYYPGHWEKRGFLYMAAGEIRGPGIVGAALVVKTVPASKYARFVHKGPTQELQLTLDYIYHTWLPKSGQSLSCPLVIEHYGEDFRSLDREESERGVYIPINSPSTPPHTARSAWATCRRADRR
jgi:AraC family transcriptional regulator